MIVDTYMPTFAFSSNFQEIVLSDVKSDVTFILRNKNNFGEYVEIIAETYTPDIDKKVYILGLSEIIASNISGASYTEFSFYFRNAEDTLIYDSKIILSRAEINISAKQFVESYFLSLMQGDKTIQVDSLQFLSLYVTDPISMKYVAQYRDSEGNYTSSTDELVNITVVDRIVGLSVSPSFLEREGYQLVKFAIIAGKRSVTFLIDRYSRPSELELIFVNNFGVSETFAVMGSIDRENKYTNELGYMRGKFKKYHIEAVKEYTANTGILDQYTADWLEDLYNSKKVNIAEAGQVYGKEITIIEATVKRSSSHSELPSHEFKYRLSQQNQVVVDFKKSSRVFDDSFDYTFN